MASGNVNTSSMPNGGGQGNGLLQSLNGVINSFNAIKTDADLSNLIAQLKELAMAFGNISESSELINLDSDNSGFISNLEKLKNALMSVASLMDGMTLDAFNNIKTAIESLNTISLDGGGEGGGIVGQFIKLRDAVQEVTTAIGSGSVSSGESEGEGGGEGESAGEEGGGETSGGGGLIQAINTMQETGVAATEALIGEEGVSGFKGVDSWVKNTAADIGTTSDIGSDESDGTLTGNIGALNSITEAAMPTVNAAFLTLSILVESVANSMAKVYEYMSGIFECGSNFLYGGFFKNSLASKNNIIPLSLADPEKYNLLSSISSNEDFLNYGTNDVQKALSKLNLSLNDGATQTTNQNTSPIINMTNTFNCPGVTSEEVLNSISSQLEKAFEGLFTNAYQRSMIHV